MAGNEKWLEELLQEAKDRNWCTAFGCTTCGAWEFRTAYLCQAAEHAGVAIPESQRYSTFKSSFKSSFQSLSQEKREKIFYSLTTALRHVAPQRGHTEALRLILLELSGYSFFQWGFIKTTLVDQIAGTPAGDEYLAMQAHSAQVAEVRFERAAYVAAAPERRAEKQLEKQLQHVARLQKTRDQNRLREALLERFSALSDPERLVFLAEQPDHFPLEMIPAELIPTGEYASGLTQEQRSRLVGLIDRRRRGWGKLRKMLEEEING